MPFQKPVDLPYCGLASGVQKLEKRKKNSWLSKIPGGSIIEATANELKGAAKSKSKRELPQSVNIPFLEKPPRYVPRPLCIPKKIQVPIHFTVFTTNVTTSRVVTPEILEQQLALTNEAFAPLAISFFFATMKYHVGPIRPMPRESKFKQQNRYSGNDEVNIWIVESIDTPTCAKRTDGYCTPASWLRQRNHPADGCVIGIDSLPGVAWRFEGGTGSNLTHEIGHWFNLWHIFPTKKERSARVQAMALLTPSNFRMACPKCSTDSNVNVAPWGRAEAQHGTFAQRTRPSTWLTT
ncbi:hypothetical protein GJ744_005655 [Endocarpon pusillum]|uniref:Peptidase M43 pregnancy-associated plasma-A domain-containing protein n=1 Tax=Endocarpon pusillum TaxID=364733 RepID=A0A8H7DZH4_9EURO|nr:hypothetical protein GJ744_005655 [Endocarpon pusillum]